MIHSRIIKELWCFIFFCSLSISAKASYIFIPMDDNQGNLLNAYGIPHYSIERDVKVDWLLNYQGGSFMIKYHNKVEDECNIRGVSFTIIADIQSTQILQSIASPSVNQDVVRLDKAPKIAIYSPKDKQPWDDAVTMALTYAEIPYEIVYDEEVLSNLLPLYDWLHLHHEDFTGQYGKFYRSHHNAQWYRDQQIQFKSVATNLGYPSVHEQKKAIARNIKNYVGNGGFLFAMCSATDSYDIALSMENVDGAHSVFDGTPIDPNLHSKLDYSLPFAFTGFKLLPDPMVYEFSDIDIPPSHNPVTRGAEADYFSLF